ncbi:MAG TPA: LPS assembly lipoprotein LptE [Edaphobacter sp.]|nr:LPS assembly lipoprotein LptE [Edaphobacter sp.]
MKLRLTLSLLSCTLLAGCGYHTAGSATHIPSNVRTMAVPIFSTRTQAYHTEMAFTQAVIRELNTQTRYRVLNKDTDDADAMLRGTIISQTITPLTYDANSSQSSSYLVSVTASIVLTAHDGTVLYRNDAVTFREQYQSTQDVNTFIQEGSPAVSRMARDFAQTIVGDMLHSF